MNDSWMNEEQWNFNRDIFNNQTTFADPYCFSFEDIVTDGLASRMKAIAISKV